MEHRLYSSTDQNLIDDWATNWLVLIKLINNVTGTDQPPTDSEELQYQRLRFWFTDHQTRFVVPWREFFESHDWASTQNNTDEGEDFSPKYVENPFLFFYEPENIYKLVQQLGLQSGVDIWEPSEYVTCRVRPLYMKLGELIIEFIDWIDQQVSDEL